MTIDPHHTPPCMAEIHRKLAAGEPVGHSARFAAAAFWLTAGVDVDEVARQFSRTPNYSAEKTRKILDGMVERQYTPPNCVGMKADGLCFNPEPLCGSLSNPISFLRARRGEHRGQSVKATDAPIAPLSLVIVKCQCDWRSGPVPEAIKEFVGSTHFFSVPGIECDNHVEVEYIPV